MQLSPGEDGEFRTILDAVRWLIRELRVSAIEVESACGISGAQLFTLTTIASAHGLSVNDVAERTLTHQSSVSVVVSRLVERGLVVRRRCQRDGRRVELEASPAGVQLLAGAPALAQCRLIWAARTLSPAVRSALAGGLAELVTAMGAGKQPPPMFFEDVSG